MDNSDNISASKIIRVVKSRVKVAMYYRDAWGLIKLD